MKRIIKFILLIFTAFIFVNSYENINLPNNAQASVNNFQKYHKNTPSKLRKTWKARKTNGYRPSIKLTKRSIHMGMIDRIIHYTGTNYQYLGNNIYHIKAKHTYYYRGYKKVYGGNNASFYIRYYSKHKIRVGYDIQSDSSKWQKFTR
ncbi:hypothetical protein OXT66_00805 [Lentilactobacillus senioris]|uniref:hypothetical protein n=1 Tax=Lentilactobacillus senioris TaxID=931534 RepID=UPI00228151FC|nr:hypothetical protein [Lentilactobacillus senioris]MCY9806084.1 hypothetical protein [Lentilactobacillus senioris]